jgi:EAL and modified HD-GYP domain-containing signal transduction protein
MTEPLARPDADAPRSATLLIGRQPIVSKSLQVEAYELLHRPAPASGTDAGERATARVLLAAIADIGLEFLVGSRPAYVNFEQRAFLRLDIRALPPDRIVLEVLGELEPSPGVVNSLRSLVDAGYRVALDDYVPDDPRASLLPLVSVLKFDVQKATPAAIQREIDRVRRPGLLLLAKKVETREEFQTFGWMGFDLFQGYFYARPTIVPGRPLLANQVAVLDVIARLQDPQNGVDELAAAIQRDVGLSFRVMRYANSSLLAAAAPIDTIRNAVIRLGMVRVRNLAALMLLGGMEGVPRSVLAAALYRARACELLAGAARVPDPASGFTVGMFSLLDAMLNQPMSDLLSQLPLSVAVAQAILLGTGPHGAILACARAFENCDWKGVELAGVGREKLEECLRSAVRWADEQEKALVEAS